MLVVPLNILQLSYSLWRLRKYCRTRWRQNLWQTVLPPINSSFVLVLLGLLYAFLGLLYHFIGN